MKRIVCFFAALIFALMLVPRTVAGTRAQLAKRVYDSVVLLYVQGEDGGMHMLCTATAYRELVKDKKSAGYRLASASHCVRGETSVEQKRSRYFITADSAGSKTFIPAKLIEAGDRKVGDDFSIFEVDTNAILEVTPLGDNEKAATGDAVVSVASPLGLGKQFFAGYISCLLIDRPPLDASSVQWNNVMLVEIGSGPGSSGSAIVSEGQEAIVGFLVGGFGGSNIGAIVLPVSKFKAFESAVDKGTYKKTKDASHEKEDE